jgi:general secretion pathway protein E
VHRWAIRTRSWPIHGQGHLGVVCGGAVHERRLPVSQNSEPREPTAEQKALFGHLLDGVQLRAGRGCKHSHYTGYRKHIGIFELLVVDPGMQDLIGHGAYNAQLRRYAQEHFFKTLVDDALEKLAAGLTTVDALFRVIPCRHISATRDVCEQ